MVTYFMLTKGKSLGRGYALLVAIIAINITAIALLSAGVLWETRIGRDMEAELIFRARQYVNAIERYRKKNNNLSPKNFQILVEKKFLRKLFPDPISDSGKWDVVMQPTTPGQKTLLIVPEEMVPDFLSRAIIIGVCSTANMDSYRVYRKKKKYHEWAFYVGDNEAKEMPALKFVSRQ